MSNFIISLFVNIRSLLIGKYYMPAMLAYFDRGKQFPALIMDNINSSIQTVLFPVFSSKQDDKNNIKQKLNMRDFMDTMRGTGVLELQEMSGQKSYGDRDKKAFADGLNKLVR